MAEKATIISYEDASRAAFVARQEAAKRPQRKSVNPKNVVKVEVKAKAEAKAEARTKAAAEAGEKAQLRAQASEEAAVADAAAPATPAATLRTSSARTRRTRSSVGASARAKAKVDATVEARSKRTAARQEMPVEGATAKERAQARRAQRGQQQPLTTWIYNWFNVKWQKPSFVMGVSFATILVVVGVFLFPVAGNYYRAIREEARLEAEYLAIIDRNTQLKDDFDFLSTDDGMIQEAREQLGMTMEGEHAVSVYGGDRDGLGNVNPEVVSGEVKPPVTWYSPVLDFIFGVE